MSAVLRYVLDL